MFFEIEIIWKYILYGTYIILFKRRNNLNNYVSYLYLFNLNFVIYIYWQFISKVNVKICTNISYQSCKVFEYKYLDTIVFKYF